MRHLTRQVCKSEPGIAFGLVGACATDSEADSWRDRVALASMYASHIVSMDRAVPDKAQVERGRVVRPDRPWVPLMQLNRNGDLSVTC